MISSALSAGAEFLRQRSWQMAGKSFAADEDTPAFEDAQQGGKHTGPDGPSTSVSAEPAAWEKNVNLRKEMWSLRSNFVEQHDLRITAATWNLAGKAAPGDLDLGDWLRPDDDADIILVALEEIVELSAAAVLGLDESEAVAKWEAAIRQHLNRDGSLAPATGSTLSKGREEPSFTRGAGWDKDGGKVEEEQRKGRMGGEDPRILMDAKWEGVVPNAKHLQVAAVKGEERARYVRVASKQLVGVHASVWVRACLKRHVSSVQVSCVSCGLLGGLLANKGAVAVSLVVHATSFCFVASHISAGESAADFLRRRADVREILRRASFAHAGAAPPGLATSLPRSIMDHDIVIWAGDFNFRLDMPYEEARPLVGNGDWPALLAADQLLKEMRPGGELEGWHEAPISFGPTYKFVFGTDDYAGDGEEDHKRRTPAWCDRVLWQGGSLQPLHYWRGDCQLSDHRPVAALFSASVDIEVAPLREEALRKALARLDARERATLPLCSLHPQAIHFGPVRYGETVLEMAEVRNTGLVPATFAIVAVTPDGGEGPPPAWVGVQPREGSVLSGQAVPLHLSAYVASPDTPVEELAEGNGQLAAILVIHLDGGGDNFLYCTAEYQRSCWGLSPERLVAMEGPIRSTPLPPRATFDEGESDAGMRQSSSTGSSSCSTGGGEVPKELRRMLAFLLEAGLLGSSFLGDTPSADSDGGVSAEDKGYQDGNVADLAVMPIREALDTASSFPEGTTQTAMATALVSYLQALPEAVLPKEVAEVVDATEGAAKMGAALLQDGHMRSWQFAMLEALLAMVQALLLHRIANRLAIQDLGLVFARVLFPQQGAVSARSLKRRQRFIVCLIEDAIRRK